MTRRIAVVGGGIAGLAAAHRLLTSGDGTTVVVLEGGERLGGKIRTTPFAGRAHVDEGADAFLARVPWAVELARRVGLGDELVTPVAGSALIWHEGLHPIPEGLLLGLPTGVRTLARSRLITWPGKLRAALEPLVPRTDLDADSLGAFVRARFGGEVHERLVDPLIGSIYAADTDRFSLAAVPQLDAVARRHRSVLLGARRAPATPAPSGAPVFYAPRRGMQALVDAAAAAITAAGGEILAGEHVAAISPTAGRWNVQTAGARAPLEPFDAVVLACPAFAAARLLAPIAPEAGAGLDVIEYADVALVTVALAPHTLPRRVHGRSGYLVPKGSQRRVTAVSFGSQKWDGWTADDGSSILRISLGRDGLPVLDLGDDDLVGSALVEVGRHLGTQLDATETRVSRWQRAFPQYRPHHAERVAAIEAALRREAPGIVLAGASYHGIGIPACVRSGESAAAVLSSGGGSARH